MRTLKLNSFIRGWIIGDFSPSLYTSKDIEVGCMYFPKGHKGDGHYHKASTEYNFIIKGKALVEGQTFTDGDCFVYEKLDKAHVEYLEETNLVVVRLPSVLNDKFYE